MRFIQFTTKVGLISESVSFWLKYRLKGAKLLSDAYLSFAEVRDEITHIFDNKIDVIS